MSWLGWGCVGSSACCWFVSVILGGSELVVQTAGVRTGVVSSLCSNGAVCGLVGLWLGEVCLWVDVVCSMGGEGDLGMRRCGGVCGVLFCVVD